MIYTSVKNMSKFLMMQFFGTPCMYFRDYLPGHYWPQLWPRELSWNPSKFFWTLFNLDNSSLWWNFWVWIHIPELCFQDGIPCQPSRRNSKADQSLVLWRHVILFMNFNDLRRNLLGVMRNRFLRIRPRLNTMKLLSSMHTKLRRLLTFFTFLVLGTSPLINLTHSS